MDDSPGRSWFEARRRNTCFDSHAMSCAEHLTMTGQKWARAAPEVTFDRWRMNVPRST